MNTYVEYLSREEYLDRCTKVQLWYGLVRMYVDRTEVLREG